MNDLTPSHRAAICRLGLKNQALLSRCLDHGFLDTARELKALDRHLSTLLHHKMTSDNSTHYIWRTVGDSKVRGSHAANNGRIFAWNNPPATGHPGEDYNCRCTAEPYVRGKTEYASQEIVSPVSDSGNKWRWYDFVLHAYRNGTGVSLGQIGHLQDIIDHYFYVVRGGRKEPLNKQIVAEARKNADGYFSYPFRDDYDFEAVSYPHGHSIVGGIFQGSVSRDKGMMSIQGHVSFYFEDRYTDPLDLREKLNGSSDPKIVSEIWRYISDGGGKVYSITDNWGTRFEANAKQDSKESKY